MYSKRVTAPVPSSTKKTGSSTDLMPSVMGAFDEYLYQRNSENLLETKQNSNNNRTSTPKRSYQLGNFANLSPCVQKILSNVPEQEISKKFNSEETLIGTNNRRSRYCYRSLRNSGINKSNESLEIISSGVHKMLSNLQDSELVINTSNLHLNNSSQSSSLSSSSSVKNQSYLFTRKFYSNYSSSNEEDNKNNNNSFSEEAVNVISDNNNSDEICETNYSVNNNNKPLGSYLHSDKGIASRTPVGRKNVGKYLQVPIISSESSSATTTSTTSASSTIDGTTSSSSEVSRPVSLTSLGSCSSSGSSNDHQFHHHHHHHHHHPAGSAYLASAESLDSDPEPAGCQGSADSGIAEQEPSSKINPEERVLQEVLDTETVYVADLNEVIQGYLEPWRNDPESCLTDYLQDLFTNLEEIYTFNRKILEDLRKVIGDATKTATVFLQHDKEFKVYNEYCARYPRTMEVLSALQRDDKISPLIREKQLQLGHALPLGSYLLKPVQRILKYHLLLQRLSKQCEPQHKSTVDLALATMTSVAADINNMKRKHEHAVRVQEIQSQLYGWTGADLTTLGELIAEGTFRMQGAKGRRHVFLFEKVLLLAKSKSDGALAYKTHIECSNLMLVEQVRGDHLSFQVLPFDNPRLQCTLRARSTHHKREWTLQIKRVILENYSAVIPNHARQLVMQLGQDVNDNDDTSERWSPLKINSITPHYLERRSRVKKSRDLSKERSISQDRSFTSFGSWRRKSEPSMIPQLYDSKVIPKKISKLKKTKEINGSSTFYTDLSDSENFESIENLSTALRLENSHNDVNNKMDQELLREGDEEICTTIISNNLEKIVSELLMQNQDFHKVFNRSASNHQHHQRHPRRNVTSEPGPIWYEDRPELPNKADSLPRSFQLNDPPSSSSSSSLSANNAAGNEEKLLQEPNRENDLSSHLDDTDHPEYKIYRKTPIRLSMLQRIKMILSEEQRKSNKSSGSLNFHRRFCNRNTGEKLANPDYVDPYTLFIGNNSRNNSETCLSLDSGVASGSFEQNEDIMGERVELDMSLNEKEVLNELEKRLNEDVDHSFARNTNLLNYRNSPSDSYYESILDKSLTEEYVRDQSTGKLVAKSDSFSNNNEEVLQLLSRPLILKRALKIPPPIPAKPLRLINRQTGGATDKTENSLINNNNNNKSWVKAMVDRFE